MQNALTWGYKTVFILQLKHEPRTASEPYRSADVQPQSYLDTGGGGGLRLPRSPVYKSVNKVCQKVCNCGLADKALATPHFINTCISYKELDIKNYELTKYGQV